MSQDKKPLKRRELLTLPRRKWDEVKVYDCLWLIPTGKKHDSGWSLIAIVGGSWDGPQEIAAFCDDICWGFPKSHPYDSVYLHSRGYHAHVMRTDCEWPSGIMRIWASSEARFKGRFRVGMALSSTDVELFIEHTSKATSDV